MGTRHLIIVAVNGKYPVAQYGQFDGYPTGVGVSVLKWLRERSPSQLATFKEKCAAVRPLDEEAVYGEMKFANREYLTPAESKRLLDRYPQLSRQMSDGILSFIEDGAVGTPVLADPEFIGDSLFCEWAYVIDFDAEVLEVYKGFNQDLTVKNRFSSLPGLSHTDGYGICTLAASWPLYSLPDADTFVSKLEPKDNE